MAAEKTLMEVIKTLKGNGDVLPEQIFNSLVDSELCDPYGSNEVRIKRYKSELKGEEAFPEFTEIEELLEKANANAKAKLDSEFARWAEKFPYNPHREMDCQSINVYVSGDTYAFYMDVRMRQRTISKKGKDVSKYTIEESRWSNHSTYTSIYKDGKGIGLCAAPCEWAHSVCPILDEDVEDLKNFMMENTSTFDTFFESKARETDSCGVYPLLTLKEFKELVLGLTE